MNKFLIKDKIKNSIDLINAELSPESYDLED